MSVLVCYQTKPRVDYPCAAMCNARNAQSCSLAAVPAGLSAAMRSAQAAIASSPKISQGEDGTASERGAPRCDPNNAKWQLLALVVTLDLLHNIYAFYQKCQIELYPCPLTFC